MLRVLICIVFSQSAMCRVMRQVEQHRNRNESQICKTTDNFSPILGSVLLNADIFRPFQAATDTIENEMQPESPFDVCDQTFLSSINGEAVHLPISQRALCPWAYQINYDANRWPRKLPVAYCLCDNVKEKMAESLETSSSQDYQKLQLDSLHRSYECELVYVTVKVVKFDCSDNNSSLVDDFEDVPVACAAIGQTAPSANVNGNLKNENEAAPPVEY